MEREGVKEWLKFHVCSDFFKYVGMRGDRAPGSLLLLEAGHFTVHASSGAPSLRRRAC